MLKTTKSKKRLNLIETICDGITHQEIFETIDYKRQSEDKIKQFTHPILVNELADYFRQREDFTIEFAREYVKDRLKWEGNVNTTVHHTLFMGTRNRPDMVLETDGLKVAIEFKIGDNGKSLRSGLGQSLIYSKDYDFVVYLFIDTSKDGRIKNYSKSEKEDEIIESLWSKYNIKFIVV